MDCDAVRLLNAESREQLLKVRNEELANVRKLQVIVQHLKSMNCKEIPLPDHEQVEKAQKLLKIANHLHLNDKKDEYVLDIGAMCAVNLSYSERGAVRHQLIKDIQEKLSPIRDFGQKLRSELPELLNEKLDPRFLIIELEKRRRSNLEKIVEFRQRKCQLLQMAADLKMGPYLGNELELLLMRANRDLLKAKVLHSYFINELLTRSEYSLKSIQEVEGYINDTLRQVEGNVI
ncbi:dim gamma-tubulin 2 isoform 1-T2 [Glossina fuscipes fuscipes]